MNDSQTLRVEDIAPEIAAGPAYGLPQVGARLTTRARTITEADIVMFASLTGDWHPQHCDAEWAKHSVFGERIAHGLLVFSFSVGLVSLEPARILALRRLHEVVFKRPTRIGETIRVEVVVDSVRVMQAPTALVAFRWRVINAEDETLIRALVEVLWRGDQPPATCSPRPDLLRHSPASTKGSTEVPSGVFPF